MKLKEYMNRPEDVQPLIHKKYEDFVNDPDVPENSIQLDSQGHIISNQRSVLNFIKFLLHEYEFLEEGKDDKKFSDDEKNSKKKSKKLKKKKLKIATTYCEPDGYIQKGKTLGKLDYYS